MAADVVVVVVIKCRGSTVPDGCFCGAPCLVSNNGANPDDVWNSCSKTNDTHKSHALEALVPCLLCSRLDMVLLLVLYSDDGCGIHCFAWLLLADKNPSDCHPLCFWLFGDRRGEYESGLLTIDCRRHGHHQLRKQRRHVSPEWWVESFHHVIVLSATDMEIASFCERSRH